MHPKFSIRSLASGSGGNCWLLEAGSTRLLVDAGLTAKQITDRLRFVGIDPETIHGIVITHEHWDHISSVPVLSRRFGYTTYTTQEVARAGRWRKPPLMHEPGVRIEPITAGRAFYVGDLTICPFSVSHDAVDPVMFVFEYHSSKLGLATDLGIVTRPVRDNLRNLDALVIESNHDIDMLLTGPYRPQDKKRISGKKGHLSNGDAQALVREIAHPGLASVTLAHLSKINNVPSLAAEGMRKALDEVHPSCDLFIALQDAVGAPIVIGGNGIGSEDY